MSVGTALRVAFVAAVDAALGTTNVSAQRCPFRTAFKQPQRPAELSTIIVTDNPTFYATLWLSVVAAN